MRGEAPWDSGSSDTALPVRRRERGSSRGGREESHRSALPSKERRAPLRLIDGKRGQVTRASPERSGKRRKH